MTVEREISSIETANINKETLDAMKNAQQAMKKIHGGLTVEKVDETMEKLEEQHMVAEEIATALSQGAINTGVDEDELDEELAELQQEELDNKMLRTGTVPVGDQIQRLPATRKYHHWCETHEEPQTDDGLRSATTNGGGRRRGRTQEAAGGDGDVIFSSPPTFCRFLCM